MPYRLKPPSLVACWFSVAFALALLIVLLIEVAAGHCPAWAHAARFGLVGGLLVANGVPLVLHRHSLNHDRAGEQPDRPEGPEQADTLRLPRLRG